MEADGKKTNTTESCKNKQDTSTKSLAQEKHQQNKKIRQKTSTTKHKPTKLRAEQKHELKNRKKCGLK